MKHREMSIVLKVMDFLSIAAALFVACAVIPSVEAAKMVPAGASVAFGIGVLPLIALAVVAWQLFSAIGRGETFVAENAARLRTMSVLAAVDAAIWLAEIIVYALAEPAPELSVTGTLSVALIITVAMCMLCVVLSHLTLRAAALKDENDLVV